MKRLRLGVLAIVTCLLTIGTSWLFPVRAVAAPGGLSAATNQELALARMATVQYHNVEQAIADGYVEEGYTSGEGFEYINFALIDCTFDPEQPEALHYVPSGNGLRLVGVEYVVPMDCTATPPEGFAGEEDEWTPEAGLPIWRVNAWIWLGNPDGMFVEAHPFIP